MPFLETIGTASAQAYGEGISGISSGSSLYSFPVNSTVTFAPTTTGQNGPTLAQAIAGLSSSAGTSWSSNTAYFNQGTYQGYQLWTVPATGSYQIQATGGSTGGSGGAIVTQNFNLTIGTILTITIGQWNGYTGGYCNQLQTNINPGGAGGTFVASGSNASTAVALIVGGGAGGNYGGGGAGGLLANGNSSQNYNGNVQTGGNGAPGATPNGSWSAGGGGFLTSGGSSPNGTNGGAGFRQGLVGGAGQNQTGGFGGGAGGHYCYENEGGGGYSGGYGGSSNSTAGGGGSYSITGTFLSATNTSAASYGKNGSCTITRLS